MDRNCADPDLRRHVAVALRKESVDRNFQAVGRVGFLVLSLSARRAWIEISPRLQKSLGVLVALRKESVDRNFLVIDSILSVLLSLSARRAWIEIMIQQKKKKSNPGRSPQGERG